MAAPSNTRPSWWHNRGYGVFVANMFGREAMKQGERSQLVVKRGDTFHLGYRILLHAARDSQPDLPERFRGYLNSCGNSD